LGRTAGRFETKPGKDLCSRILEVMEEERKNKKEIVDRLDILNEKCNEILELETIKQSQDITSLREETQQRIQVVICKFNSLSSGVYARWNMEN
jgi:hypothetical protein